MDVAPSRFAVASALAWLLWSVPARGQGPTLSASPAAVQFSYTIGGAVPKEQKVTVKQSSGAALTFSVTVSAGAPWLIATPTSGKTGTAFSLYVNPSSLLAGDYLATVTIEAAGSAGPVSVPVTLQVRTPPPTMSAQPNALTYTWQTDQPVPASQTLAIATDGEPVSLTFAAAGGTWLAIDRTNGIAVAGSPVLVTASLSPQGLNPGSYTGKITISSTNAVNKKIDVAVTLTVQAGVAVLSSIWPSAAPIGSLDTTITLRGQHLFKDRSVVRAGTTVLQSTWLSTDAMLAVIPRNLLTAEGTLAITVTNPPQAASNTLNFTVTPPGPRVQAVVNAASFHAPWNGANPVVSPGEIIAIFGSGMGPSSVLQATPVCNPAPCVFPTSLGTPPVLVEFELTPTIWTPAPLVFVFANQINAVVPFAATSGSTVAMRVTYNALVSDPVTLAVEDAEPGLFTTDSSGRGQGAILNFHAATNSYSLNSGNNPALKGSTVVMFLTGGGALNPAASDGAVIAAPAPVLTGSVSVSIAGDGATVTYAGAVPGSIAGLVQLNVTVPTTAKSGKDLPVVVTIAGRSSPATATIAVK
jgi:uncharacterized protein (TIGR03437 family)